MSDTAITITAAQRAQIIAAAYKLVDFTRHLVKTYPGGQAQRDEQQAFDIAAGRLLDLLQDL